ncbi:MAG TPA: hypothetical protein P5051_01350 [Methanothrix sp.]|nr:hypothetical protein [Methanothrix sp.]
MRIAARGDNAHQVPAQVACTDVAGRGSLIDEIVENCLAIPDGQVDIAGLGQRHGNISGYEKGARISRNLAEPTVWILAGEQVIHRGSDPGVVIVQREIGPNSAGSCEQKDQR